jgi:hypothetical protein
MRIATLCILLIATAAPAFAQTPPQIELPNRRPGHWQIKMMMEGRPDGPEMMIQACTDAATERQMMQYGMGQMGQACSRYEIRRQGADYLIETDCQMGPMRTTSRTVMSGDFQSRYTVRIEGTVASQGQAQPQATLMVQEARWMSATCTGGLVPGDIQLPTGQKVNIRDIGGAATGRQPRRP